MPALLIQFIEIYANLLILVIVGYYFLKFKDKEKELDKREGKIDTEYHQVVDTALARERKILDDASAEADKIIRQATEHADQLIGNAQRISQTTADHVNQSLQRMAATVEKETVDTAKSFISNYEESLKQLTDQSLQDFRNNTKTLEGNNQQQIQEFHKTLQQALSDFQTVAKGLETDLQKQIKDFHDSLLPSLQKELEGYKQVRMQYIENNVKQIVQKAAGEILNKSLSLEDHQKLVIESLEKAKKEGMFD